ncbi:MAG: hypothetical protein QOF89_463 [Acidobacteriota bacterium]|jgi:hypothetical protein|nr:hypothetical protein [Acidobacteriota bacterium]
MFKTVVRILGTLESLIASLPMPWKMRMWIGGLLGRMVAWVFDHVPGIYVYLINENRRFGMGKSEHGEMQSIRALNKVLRELEQRGVPPARVRSALAQAEEQKISKVQLPRFLSDRLLGAQETELIFSRYAGI